MTSNKLILHPLLHVIIKRLHKQPGFPLGLEKTGKPGKMGRHFPVREKSGNFEQTGKVREKSGKTPENTGKLRKFQKIVICYFSMIFK